MPTDLSGKVAVVTGGSRGIGFAIASALLDRGACVTISGINAANLRRATERLGSAGRPGRIDGFEADVREYERVAALMQATVGRYGGLDILINNAGTFAPSEVAELPIDDWRLVIDTNLTGVFHCCRAAIPHLRRRGGGWIISISSLAGKNPFAGAAAYCASKAGLNAFSEALMQELRHDDIRVSCVMPGSVRTGFGGHSVDAGTEWKLAPEDVARVVVDLIGHDPRSLPSRVELRPSKPRV